MKPGDRIFPAAYLDFKGRMTIAQWNTAAFGTDYRLAPLAAGPRPSPGNCRRTPRRDP